MNIPNYDACSLSELVGKVITRIVKTDEMIDFVTEGGEEYRMCHRQDCCETVTIDDIVGDLNSLIGTPVLMAREETNNTDPSAAGDPDGYVPDSYTWTYYLIDTIRGNVTIKWYGESNGYYSETADFVRLPPGTVGWPETVKAGAEKS